MTASDLTHAREIASRDLLSTLSRVKTWVRAIHTGLYADHSPAAVTTLALVDQLQPARVSALAETARVDVSVVSRHVTHLEHQGLVERSPDPDDGRAHRVSLSPAGAAVLERGRERLAGLVSDRLERWTAEEIQRFSDDLRRLLHDLAD